MEKRYEVNVPELIPKKHLRIAYLLSNDESFNELFEEPNIISQSDIAKFYEEEGHEIPFDWLTEVKGDKPTTAEEMLGPYY